MIRIHYSNAGEDYFNLIVDRFFDFDENKDEIIKCIEEGLKKGFVVSIMDTKKVISFK